MDDELALVALGCVSRIHGRWFDLSLSFVYRCIYDLALLLTGKLIRRRYRWKIVDQGVLVGIIIDATVLSVAFVNMAPRLLISKVKGCTWHGSIALTSRI
jgi:hypothetical protein